MPGPRIHTYIHTYIQRAQAGWMAWCKELVAGVCTAQWICRLTPGAFSVPDPALSFVLAVRTERPLIWFWSSTFYSVAWEANFQSCPLICPVLVWGNAFIYLCILSPNEHSFQQVGVCISIMCTYSRESCLRSWLEPSEAGLQLWMIICSGK